MQSHRIINLVLLLILCSAIFIKPAAGAALNYQLDDQGTFLEGTFEGSNQDTAYVFSPWLSYSSDFDGETVLSVREAYFSTTYHGLDWSFGRKLIKFGPGRYGNPILGPLGEEPRTKGYDQLGYSFNNGNLSYQKFYAWVPEAKARMLLGQRITYLWGNLTLGFSETALLNNEAPNYFYQPYPYIPIYLLQSFSIFFDVPNVNRTANINMQFDADWQCTPNLRLYGVYFIDDRPIVAVDDPEWEHDVIPRLGDNPWRVGYQAGSEWQKAFGNPKLQLYLEYTRISQFTYTGLNQELTYTYQDNLIGDRLGPDADRFNLELQYQVNNNWSIGTEYIRERHGEGKLGDVWEPVVGQGEVFLTGTVEKIDRLRLHLKKRYYAGEITLTVGGYQIDNHDNILDETAFGRELILKGKLFLD